MAGTSDKARFYMEQTVPQLQEFEQKKIFTKEEIQNLVKKRSDFEHKVLSRSSAPVDFARYATWEMNLERLRQKRCKKLGIHGSSAHAGQAQVFRIFHRGTTKHAGDVGLWLSYLQYARDAQAPRKFAAVLTSAIRLHCTKPALWLYAAKWALEEQADMRAARGYMQQGTRFCTTSRALWIEYAKLEMIYLKKIALRRRILGLDGEGPGDEAGPDAEPDEEGAGFDEGADVIRFSHLPLRPSLYRGMQVDDEAKMDPYNTPALRGAIPMAIFDSAQKQPFYTPAVAEAFYDMFAAFTQVPCLPQILQHVLDRMMAGAATDASTCFCYIRHPIVGIRHDSWRFPAALIVVLERLWECTETTRDRAVLVRKATGWLKAMLALEGLDSGIKTALTHALRRL